MQQNIFLHTKDGFFCIQMDIHMYCKQSVECTTAKSINFNNFLQVQIAKRHFRRNYNHTLAHH
jgi:hypothetical protein